MNPGAKEGEMTDDAIRQGIKEAEGVTGDVDNVLDLVGTFIDHHKAKEDQLTQLQQDVRPLLDTLNSIACYNQGEIVTGSFDEPASAEQARQALETFLAKHPDLKQ